MYTRRLSGSIVLLTAVACALERAVAVQVTGAVEQPLTLNAGEWAKVPRASVTTTSDGQETTLGDYTKY